jgi:hypothetical protein
MMLMKPIPPRDGTPAASWRDHAKDGFSLSALENLVRDCEEQPEWRPNADLNVAYYDGKQLTELQKHTLRLEGLEPRVTNLIGRVINGVLGQEAKSRSDVRVEADDDAVADVCDVFNMRLKEAQREAYADMAVSNAYSGQVKAGIGWVEVSRDSDPLNYPYRVMDVHRNEMWWDWRAKDFLLRDARWLVRKRWQDLDELQAVMPEYAEILKHSSEGWQDFLLGELDDDLLKANERLYSAREREQSFRVRRSEWMETTRRRVKLYEVWYKVPAMAVVLHLSPTRRVLFDETNPLHVEAVARGLVKITKSVTRQVRMALFAGPHRLYDIGTTRRSFPYVPFFAFRDDEDLTPYGLVDGMRAPQDEYNERRLRIQWMLKAKQIWVDDDALNAKYNTFEDLAGEAMRPDFMAVLNANRRNANALKIGNDMSLQKEQVDVMQDAKQLIQDIPGVYSTQLGNAPTGVTSGLAINSLVEQGMVSMGELNDNYRHSRRMVFENLLELIVEDHLDRDLEVIVGQGSSKRSVLLNTVDPETGAPKNMVKDAPIRVGLSDVPATPAFKLQQQQQIAAIIGALGGNPQAVAILTPAFIEATSLENRQQIADDIRRATGQPTAGDRQAAEARQVEMQQEQAEAAALQKRAAVAGVEKQEAEVQKTRADAQKSLAQAQAETVDTELSVVQALQPPVDTTPPEDQLIDEALAEAMG